MLFERIVSEGISHISYLIGSGGQAAVIDPRRDCECYLEIARRNDLVITHIFETHRNEDYVIGSQELAAYVCEFLRSDHIILVPVRLKDMGDNQIVSACDL